MKRAIGYGLTMFVGAVAGFFLAGPVLFADGSMNERMAALGLTAIIFLLLGALSGRWLRTWTAGIWLALPGLAIALILGEKWSIIGLTMGTLLVSTAVGAWIGTHWGRKGPS